MAKQQVRLALIGCGGIGQEHLKSYEAIRERGADWFTIVALCDRVEDRAQTFCGPAQRFQAVSPRVYADLEEMLAREELDCADICLPHGLHHTVAVQCMEAGLDVMVEKPLGVTVRASRIIVQAGERLKRIVATAEQMRRYPGQRAAHWIINQKKLIGEPRMFFAQQAAWRPVPVDSEPMRWRVQKVEGGGGQVFDSGAHYMDTVRYLFGDAHRVYAQMRTYERRIFHDKTGEEVPADVEDSWTATITFKSGVIGVWTYFPAARGKEMCNVVYYGSEGSLEDLSMDTFHGLRTDGELRREDGLVKSFKDLQIEYLLSLPPAEKEHLFPLGLSDGIALECYDFLDAVRHQRPPDIDGWQGLKAKAISDAIFESAYTHQAVSVDDIIACKIEEYQRPINERWGIV